MTMSMWRACGGRVSAAAIVVLWLSGAAAAQAPQDQRPTTKTTWYFYTVTWGSQDEFLDLFQKNHYPLLKAQQQAGRFAAVRTWVPQYHGDGRADWTFVVEIVERVGPTGGPTEQELIAKMYPDQATFRKEEHRRFELLVAHWDVPLNAIDLETRKPGM
jgi:hypothetical protein